MELPAYTEQQVVPGVCVCMCVCLGVYMCVCMCVCVCLCVCVYMILNDNIIAFYVCVYVPSKMSRRSISSILLAYLHISRVNYLGL